MGEKVQSFEESEGKVAQVVTDKGNYVYGRTLIAQNLMKPIIDQSLCQTMKAPSLNWYLMKPQVEY